MSTEQPTPRTDLVEMDRTVVWSEFARQLERELHERGEQIVMAHGRELELMDQLATAQKDANRYRNALERISAPIPKDTKVYRQIAMDAIDAKPAIPCDHSVGEWQFEGDTFCKKCNALMP